MAAKCYNSLDTNFIQYIMYINYSGIFDNTAVDMSKTDKNVNGTLFQ